MVEGLSCLRAQEARTRNEHILPLQSFAGLEEVKVLRLIFKALVL